MTGFGRGTAEIKTHDLLLEVEIASVNRKNLDLFVSSPKEWSGLEQVCGEWVRQSFLRGRVNLQIKVQAAGGETTGLSWNHRSLEESIERLRNFALAHGIKFETDASFLLQLAQTLKDSSSLPDWRELQPELKTAVSEALGDIDAMREREGRSLQNDLAERIGLLEATAESISKAAKDAAPNYRDALLDRLAQLGLELDLDDDRVLKEVALFADRSDISEELTRLRSHFEQFREFIASGDACGRKMDFLCQEIHREFNTCGSKSTRVEITRAVIEGKNELERIREQVQNVE